MSVPPDPAAHFPDHSNAPFALQVGASPEQVADQILSSFRAIADLDRPASCVLRAIMATIGLDPSDPLAIAGRELAVEIDHPSTGQHCNAYHNRQHTCEVALSGLFLARLARLPPSRQARVAIAALVHDFHHDGATNAGETFRLERMAVHAALPFLLKAGVAPAEVDCIAAAVLATELTIGAPYARRCFDYLHQGGTCPDPPGQATGDVIPLKRLASDPDLAFEAVLLAEADLLPSVALGNDYSMLCQARLARENQQVGIGHVEKLAFLDREVQSFRVAGFFEPNLTRLRHSLAAAVSLATTEITMTRDAIDVLPNIPLFADVDAGQLGELVKHANLRSYRTNTVVMEKGDEANALYVLLSGRVKVFAADDNGKSIVLNELGPGDYLGELALIEHSTRTASVMTLTPARFLVIPKASFEAFLVARPTVALALLGALASRVRKLTEDVERLALRDVYSRLADILFARAVEEDGCRITDALTQRDLADLIGASREMVSRILKDLKAGGYISLEGKRIIIHRKLPVRW